MSTYQLWVHLPPLFPKNLENLHSTSVTNRQLFANAFDRVHNKPNDICESDHPNPFRLVLVPNEKLFDVFVNHYIDRVKKRDRFVDRTHCRIYGHAVVRTV
jgi:hypothetical protein